MIAKYST